MESDKILKLEYKLVGTINMFDVIPEFVIPVFDNEGQYFIQNTSNPLKIELFDFLFNQELINSIRPLDDCELIMPTNKLEYEEGDDYLYGYQRNENEIFVGTFKEFKNYIHSIDIDDDFMKIEIPYVIGQIEEYKLKKKKTQ